MCVCAFAKSSQFSGQRALILNLGFLAVHWSKLMNFKMLGSIPRNSEAIESASRWDTHRDGQVQVDDWLASGAHLI